MGALESWIFGKFGPAERAAAAWLMDAVWPEGALCCSCGRITGGGSLCAGCLQDLRARGFAFAWDQTEPARGVNAWGLRPHDGIHRTLVHRLKFGAEARAADALASLVLPLPEWLSFSPDTVVTWVPMPEYRFRDRSIDHGRLLAEAVSRQLSLPCRQLLRRRKKQDKSQLARSMADRMKNLADAFEPLEGIPFSVLLVDDVRTTGTTIARCSEALLAGGAQQVATITMTFARQNN